MPVSPAGDDLIHSEEVSGAQHSPKIPGILQPLEDEPQLLGVVSWPGHLGLGLGPGPGPQGAHFHADALVNLVTAQFRDFDRIFFFLIAFSFLLLLASRIQENPIKVISSKKHFIQNVQPYLSGGEITMNPFGESPDSVSPLLFHSAPLHTIFVWLLLEYF